MSKYGQTKKTLKEHSLAPKKKLGQNFLVHKRTADSIVAAGNITKENTVLEVGVGLGALTAPLASVAKHVFGYEIDSGIIRFHEEQGELPENVTLIHQDILRADFNEIHQKCGNDLIIMANLPYSISNPFIFTLIENAHLISKATIMLQKEVGDRLMAVPKTKAYGIPTILLGACATVKKLMTLKPGEFHPQPKVDSVVVEIDFSRTDRLNSDTPEYDRRFFSKLVRIAFSQRRKTLLNTLSSGSYFLQYVDKDKALNKKHTGEAIEMAGITPSIRPECLDIVDFIQLALSFEKSINRLKVQS